MKLTVGAWDPGYGPTLQPDQTDEASRDVTTTVEVAGPWQPITPPSATARPSRVLFLDGVRRIDAALWATPAGAVRPRQTLAASFAAGVMACTPTAATVEAATVRRILAGPSGIDPIEMAGATYTPVTVGEDPTAVQLSNAIQERLGLLEQAVAHQAGPADLVVIDGPLSGRQQIPSAVGYVKTHQVAYLDEAHERTVADLAGGQRTPMFLTAPRGATGYGRLSFYLRLIANPAHPWEGIVRLEMSPDRPMSDASQLADLLASLLPTFASEGYWDARSPQNLVPIAALERELRHLLGDQAVLERQLRHAVAA